MGEYTAVPHDGDNETGAMPGAPAGTRCLRALLDVVRDGIIGEGEPDSRLVEAIDESRSDDGADELVCRESCGAACDAAFRRQDGQIRLDVTNERNFDNCCEGGL